MRCGLRPALSESFNQSKLRAWDVCSEAQEQGASKNESLVSGTDAASATVASEVTTSSIAVL